MLSGAANIIPTGITRRLKPQPDREARGSADDDREAQEAPPAAQAALQEPGTDLGRSSPMDAQAPGEIDAKLMPILGRQRVKDLWPRSP